MSPREKRAFVLASLLLLGAASARALHRGTRGRGPLPADSLGALPVLVEDAREARALEARRRTPLADGERLDPNRAPPVELQRLPGVGPAVARALDAARDSGPPFLGPDDLLRVRGIGPATARRLTPHLDFSRPPPVTGTGRRARPRARIAPGGAPSPERRGGASSGPTVLDLNRADRGALVGLPGIGPALARRILEERERRGRFRRVEELLEVRGIGPATLGRLRSRLRVGR